MSCETDKLESLALGELSKEEATEVRAHAAGCASCAEELRLFEAERGLFARRADAEPRVPARVWLRVEEQLRPRTPWWRYLAPAVTLVMALALVLLVVKRRHEPSPGMRAAPVAQAAHKSDAKTALDAVDASQAAAVAKLEAAYQARRASLPERAVQRWDTQLATLKQKLDTARVVARDDVEGRRRLTFATARYVHSLQNVLLEEESP